MPWKIIKRKLGRAGGLKQRSARQRKWDQQFGEGMWTIGYLIDGDFVEQEEAIHSVYNKSYEAYFEAQPEEIAELIAIAKKLRNPHAEATSSVDLQVPAIMAYLGKKGLVLSGREVVDIGTWRGERSHGLSVRLSPLQIPCVANPRWTLEKYWQEKKCLAVWEEE